jgi:UDP:flavonoid glycosyltransferase YjiC (YdhE family)
MVIGSRGDAQPFLKIGKVLKEQCGHRVRIATHPAFREFVEKDSGLEFFSVGGDPSELMAFMVKNPGMIPTLETVRAGDIGRRRAAMAEMFEGFWRACINATDDGKDVPNIKMMGEKDPFVADAIIANPPSFAHIHCAEALGIPLHLMFTFPYTPTEAFPHPLASIKKSNVDPGYTNFISYPLVEMMVWQGLGDLVNDFRVNTLGLDPVSTLWAPGATYRLHVPFTYLWSPGLVPKPKDWGDEIDVSGFVFLDLASSFTPPDPLTQFLASGDTPIYIGFGSIVVDDADRFTQMIFEAVEMAGVRALVSKGWGGLGGDSIAVPDNVFMLENTPHDWLFPQVRACVIHGGAGTTAIALKCGKPTMIVPFFGDQHFWGSMVANSAAGPEPVPYKRLTAEKLAEGIKYCLTDEAVKAAETIARDIEKEGDGAENACRAFHQHLNLAGPKSMHCSILEDRVATWYLKHTHLRLSSVAADILVEKGYFPWRKLRLLRHNEWNDFEGPGEPVTGVAGSLMTTIGDVFGGIGGVPYRMAKSSRERREEKEKKRMRKEERERRRRRRNEELAAANHDSIPRNETETGRDITNGTEEHSKANHDSVPGNKTHASGDSRIRTKERSAANGLVQHGNHERNDTETGEQSPEDAVGRHDNQTRHESQHGNDNRNDTETEDQNRELPNVAMAMQRTQTATTTASSVAGEAGLLNNPAGALVGHVGRGAAKSAGALARAPMELSMALAQGFHNAPRLYGDDTVRRPPRVTGMQSGMRAAGREFALGVYDACSGLVRLPVRGWREDRVRGFTKGIGMGITGFVLKNIAAVAAPVGYGLKGVAKQAARHRQPVKYVRRARMVQSQRELRALEPHERHEIEKQVTDGWEVMRELWEAIEVKENQRKLRLRALRVEKTKGRGKGPAFESVETARKELQKITRGQEDEAKEKNATNGKADTERGHDEREMLRPTEEKLPNGHIKGTASAANPKPSPVGDVDCGHVPLPETKENPFSATHIERLQNKVEAKQDESDLLLHKA